MPGEIVAAAGWTVTAVERAPDDIEVDFRQGPTEVEIDDGRLEVETHFEVVCLLR